MLRLFVAIRPPQPVRDQLLDLMDGVAGVHWQDEEQLHLTLRFVGEVERPLAEDLALALARLRHPPLTVRLAGVGRFEAHRRGALWAAAVPRDELAALAAKVDRACVMVGLAADQRSYHPHVTLARFGRGAEPADHWLARWSGFSSDPFIVTALDLYQSRLSHSGAQYELIHRFELC